MAFKKFFGVGACYLDTILNVPHFVKEDEKLRASSITRRRGGNCPNTIEVLQQLMGLRIDSAPAVNLIAVLPSQTSPATQEIRESLGHDVSISTCIHREEQTEPASSYIIRSQATGSRTIINYNALPEMTLDEFAGMVGTAGEETEWYHFEGRIPDVTLQCLRHLRQQRPYCKISVEVEKPGREGLQELAAAADVVFYSKTWALSNGYPDAETCLREQALLAPQASLLCCTWGSEGALCFNPSSQELCRRAAFTEANKPVVDTIGAGDTFIAGVLYSCLVHPDDWTLARRLDFANELAGRKVSQEGFTRLAGFMRTQL